MSDKRVVGTISHPERGKAAMQAAMTKALAAPMSDALDAAVEEAWQNLERRIGVPVSKSPEHHALEAAIAARACAPLVEALESVWKEAMEADAIETRSTVRLKRIIACASDALAHHRAAGETTR